MGGCALRPQIFCWIVVLRIHGVWLQYATLVPEIEMSPVSKETSPNIALISVDLPDPTGPVMMVVVEAFS
jgi:hypothetical protein